MHRGSREEDRGTSNVSVLNWIGTLILALIPFVNIVMFIVWAVTSKIPSKRTYAIASIICVVIGLVVFFAAIALFGDAIVEFLKALDTSSLRDVAMN